jgi:hypothetical protein
MKSSLSIVVASTLYFANTVFSTLFRALARSCPRVTTTSPNQPEAALDGFEERAWEGLRRSSSVPGTRSRTLTRKRLCRPGNAS